VAGNFFEPRADLDGVGAAPELSIAAEQAAAEHAEVDPESIVLVVIRGVPEGARLSAGVLDEDGSWLVSPLDLPSVAISLPSEGVGGEAQGGEGDLSITGMALAEDGALAAISETVPLADYLGDPGPGVQMLPGSGAPAASNSGLATEPRRIPLEVDPHVAAHEPLDALVIRDLPAAARLSAGAYDAAINGWVLMPHDVSGLAILPPADLREDFTVTLLGVALRPCETNAVRVLARLPVTLA
jgi:large repetitive protein